MKKTVAYAIMFSAIFISGCDVQSKEPHNASISNHTINTSGNQVYNPLYETEEEKELKTIVEKMKAQDPSIVDAYYSLDEKGEKVLNLVKQDESLVNNESSDSSSGLSTFMWAVAGGFTANMLYNAFTSNKGNMNAVNNQYKPMSTNRSSYSDYTYRKQNSVKSYRDLQAKSISKPEKTVTQKKLTAVDSSKNVQPLSQNSYRDQPYKNDIKEVKKTTKKSTYSPFRKKSGFSFRRKR